MVIYYLKFCLLLSLTTISADPITISLPRFNTSIVYNNTFTLSPNSDTPIFVTNLHKSIRYFIIQTHSLQPTTLSNTTTYTRDTTVSGTNIGLLQYNDLPRYKFYAKNPNERNSTILLLIVAYPDNVPVPGGCNMEYMVETAPYQILNYTEEMVTVEAQSAALEGFVCESALVNYKMYHMYLPELDFSSESYFEAIMKMVTPEDVEKNGFEIHKHIPNKQLRRLYSSYKGTGAIYALVSYNGPFKSAYVPIATYACDATNSESSCDSSMDHLGKFFMGLTFFVGLFMCFCGHKYFKNEVFFVGVLLGSGIAYLVCSSTQLFTETGTMATAISIGFVSGVVCLAIWYIYGIPLVTVMVIFIVFGFIVSAIMFQAGLGDINVFVSDLNYWSCLCCICLMIVILMLGFTHEANILASSTIGALVCILATDFLVGSYLKYTFINIYRRAYVQDFGYAVIHGPFQYKDITLTCFFVVFLILGTLFQRRQALGRPPFAPSPYHTSQIGHLNERTPLLVHEAPQDPRAPQVPSAPNYRLIA